MIKVYTLKNCQYCVELKTLLEKDNIVFLEIDIDLPENEKEFSDLAKIAESETVPMVKMGNKLLVANRTFHTISEGHLLIKKLLDEE